LADAPGRAAAGVCEKGTNVVDDECHAIAKVLKVPAALQSNLQLTMVQRGGHEIRLQAQWAAPALGHVKRALNGA